MRRCLAISALVLAISGAASAETYFYTSALNGFQEVPPTDSQGVGVISMTLDDSDFTVSGTGLVFFLSDDPIDFHIHHAPFGVSGPIVLPIGPTAFIGNTIDFDIALSGETEFNNLKAILDMEHGYFNIHTEMFPAGEIRGQIAPVPEPASLAVLGLALTGLLRRKRKA